MNTRNPVGIKHRQDIANALLKAVGGWVMRSIAAALAARVEKNGAVGIAQRLDVARIGPSPIIQAAKKAEVEDEGGPLHSTS